jgi:hypothetical protein
VSAHSKNCLNVNCGLSDGAFFQAKIMSVYSQTMHFNEPKNCNPLSTMNLTPIQREQLRLAILRLCLDPMRPGLLLAYLRSEGFGRLVVEQLEHEIMYLADKQLLTSAHGPVSPELKHWRTTATGRDALAQQGNE